MNTITMTLDGFCAELSRVFEQVNNDLPVISEQKGADTTQLFSYRLPLQAVCGLQTIPHSKFHRNHAYRLQEFSVGIPCYLTTRKCGKDAQAVLILQRPNWWQKIHYPHILKHLEIHVTKVGVNLVLNSCKVICPTHSHRHWIFLLTEHQQSQFADLVPRTSWWRSLQKIWHRF